MDTLEDKYIQDKNDTAIRLFSQVGKYPYTDSGILDEKAKACLMRGGAAGEIASEKARLEFIATIILRQANPNPPIPTNRAPTVEEFLGKEGLEQYWAALKEEAESEAYRMAVVEASLSRLNGPPFFKRPIILIGGPSASGKTFARNYVLLSLETELPRNTKDNSENILVNIDGGIIRETSQMRKLLIQAANLEGHKGLSDLHEKSNVLEGIKPLVEEAAMQNQSVKLGIIKPDTFSDWVKPAVSMEKGIYFPQKEYMDKISGIPDAQVIFAMVEGEDATFRDVVHHMGENRAWKVDGFEELTVNSLDLNNKEGVPESKEYGPGGFELGVYGTNQALECYRENHQKKPSYVVQVPNELMLVKEDGDKWVPANYSDGGKMVHRAIYEQWETIYKEDPDAANEFRKINIDTPLPIPPAIKIEKNIPPAPDLPQRRAKSPESFQATKEEFRQIRVEQQAEENVQVDHKVPVQGKN